MCMLMLVQNSTISQTGSASGKTYSKLQKVTDPGAMGPLWSRVTSIIPLGKRPLTFLSSPCGICWRTKASEAHGGCQPEAWQETGSKLRHTAVSSCPSSLRCGRGLTWVLGPSYHWVSRDPHSCFLQHPSATVGFCGSLES